MSVAFEFFQTGAYEVYEAQQKDSTYKQALRRPVTVQRADLPLA